MKIPILPTKPVRQASAGFAAVCLGAFMFAAISPALAQNLWQNPDLTDGGDWLVATNWSGGIPTSSSITHIDNKGLAIITTNAATREFVVGNTTTNNRLEILGGILTTRGVTIGSVAGSSGSVLLASGATWKTDGATEGVFTGFTVGASGAGTLLVESGATLHSGRTIIGSLAGSTGEATVRGAWIWEHNAGTYIGLGPGNGILNLGAGGKIDLTGSMKVVSLGANAILNIGGKTAAEAAGRLNAGSVNGAGTLNFNHTDTNYIFETETNTPIAITGTATVNQVSGTTTLTANNTYSGATTVTGGTLALNAASGLALGSTASVTVSANATLLLSRSDQVNNAAAVTLSGGTIQRAGGVSETFGNLSLTAASFLNYGTAHDPGDEGTLAFGTYTPSALLTVSNFFEGNVLMFKSDLSASINNGTLFSFDNAFTFDWDGGTGTFTITAIPEPSAHAAAAVLIGLMLWPLWRRAKRV